MKETLELRINYDYAHLLFSPEEGRNVGTSVRVVNISESDPRYFQIPEIDAKVKDLYDRGFYYHWRIKRKYSKEELKAARLFNLTINTIFEPAGEECGTLYDEAVACEICGAGSKQTSPLRLRKGSVPKKDIAKTIAGEVVVSARFASAIKKRRMKGIILNPVFLGMEASEYYQLVALEELELTKDTKTGDDPFGKTEGSEGGVYDISGYEIKLEKEVYVCPKDHLVGLNILSEPYVLSTTSISICDFFATRQKIGVRRGLLRPEPLYLCSPAFREMVAEEKLGGFEFEVARVDGPCPAHMMIR